MTLAAAADGEGDRRYRRPANVDDTTKPVPAVEQSRAATPELEPDDDELEMLCLVSTEEPASVE